MDVTTAIETRVEVREYADEPVDESTIRAILNAARLAPSGMNRQHWAFVLVTDSDDIDRLAELSTSGYWVADAAFAVVILTDPSYGFNEIDAGRAVTYMQLAAWTHGVGSCIYTGFDADGMQRFLDIPESLNVTLVAGFGQPTRPVDSFVGRKDREPLKSLVHDGRFGHPLGSA